MKTKWKMPLLISSSESDSLFKILPLKMNHFTDEMEQVIFL